MQTFKEIVKSRPRDPVLTSTDGFYRAHEAVLPWSASIELTNTVGRCFKQEDSELAWSAPSKTQSGRETKDLMTDLQFHDIELQSSSFRNEQQSPKWTLKWTPKFKVQKVGDIFFEQS